MPTEKVEGIASLFVIDDPDEIAASDSPGGKPFLRVEFNNGVKVSLSTNLAEMIGGAGAGVRKRYEDRIKGAH
jgi:hypothetical protein